MDVGSIGRESGGRLLSRAVGTRFEMGALPSRAGVSVEERGGMAKTAGQHGSISCTYSGHGSDSADVGMLLGGKSIPRRCLVVREDTPDSAIEKDYHALCHEKAP